MKPAKTKIATLLTVIIMVAASLAVIIQLNSQPKMAAQVIRVACVGDSITEWSNYPETLQKLLGEGYVVGNFGVAGSAVTKASDIPYMNQAAFQKAKDFQPDIVIIMLGTNDAKDFNYRYIYSFFDDYHELVTSIDSLPDEQKIFLVTPPPIYNNDLGLDNSNLEAGVIPKIEEVAYNLNLPTIDVNSALADHSDYFKDGVHPNDAGAEAIANIINNAITDETSIFEIYQYLLNVC